MAGYKILCVIGIITFSNRGIQSSQIYSPRLPEPNDVTTSINLRKEEEVNRKYKILEANETIFKLLTDDIHGISRSEVIDMLQSKDENEKHLGLPSFPTDNEYLTTGLGEPTDLRAELIQEPGDTVPKDSIKQRSVKQSTIPVGTAAVIMVVVTCLIVCIAYISLILWRRFYLKRNGLQHELLSNQEPVAETVIEL